MSAIDQIPFQLSDESIRAVDDAITGRPLIREPLAILERELVVCGMVLGYAVPEAPKSRVRTKREPAAAFTDCCGF